MHKYVRKDVFAKISRPTPEEEVCTNWARRGGIYTTKDMRPSPKRHTPTPKNRAQRKISGDKLFLLLLHHGTV